MNRETARQRAKELVAQMTIEERASQLRYDAPAIERLGIPEYNWWGEGLHGVARAGTATSYPQAIALAACFDPQSLQTAADQISTEARAKYNAASAQDDRDIYKGLTLWSPNINIFRDPRWGRGQETYGEDPFLTKTLGKAFVRGLQGDAYDACDPEAADAAQNSGQAGKDGYLKVAACAKHFAVHSGPEALRHEFDARASLKDMGETYLPAFEALVREAGVESVMGAYNRTNGEPCCGSDFLIQKTLRGEWKFKGHFVSDCWAVRDFHEHHHVTGSEEESAALALNTGCDLNCGCTYMRILEALDQGLLSEETVTEAAVRLMTTRIMLGMMDEDCAYDNIPYTMVEAPEHLAMSERLAQEAVVLLKNDGVLPLDREKTKTIAVIGPNADDRGALVGNYHGTASEYITVLEGIRRVCGPDTRILYSQGCDKSKDRVEPLSQYPGDRISEAVTVASLSDVAIVVVGLDENMEGEEGDTGNAYASGDKGDLLLPDSQRALLQALTGRGTPVIVCNMSGSAMDLSYAQDNCSAVLQAWYPGARGGLALARILFGDVSPSGKLPVTFYYNETLDDLPDFEDYTMQGRTYRFMAGEALYPFGYGLTYSDVQIASLTVSRLERETQVIRYLDGGACPVPGFIDLQVQAENRGERKTDEVVQIYVKNLTSDLAQENYHLCGFERITLLPGESRTVTIRVPLLELAVVTEEGRRVLDGDSYRFYAGTHQPDARSCALSGTQVQVLECTL